LNGIPIGRALCEGRVNHWQRFTHRGLISCYFLVFIEDFTKTYRSKLVGMFVLNELPPNANQVLKIYLFCWEFRILQYVTRDITKYQRVLGYSTFNTSYPCSTK